MKKKLLTLTLTLCVCAIPLWAIVGGRSLTNTLKELCTELKTAYQQRTEAQQRFNDDYERQHQRMIDVVTESNELSILLYTQEQEMTFDLAYALKRMPLTTRTTPRSSSTFPARPKTPCCCLSVSCKWSYWCLSGSSPSWFSGCFTATQG
jgi:hypothetical protein